MSGIYSCTVWLLNYFVLFQVDDLVVYSVYDVDHWRLCWWRLSSLHLCCWQLKEVYTLLNENYVEDDDNMFRFDYSPEFLHWSVTTIVYYQSRANSDKALLKCQYKSNGFTKLFFWGYWDVGSYCFWILMLSSWYVYASVASTGLAVTCLRPWDWIPSATNAILIF